MRIQAGNRGVKDRDRDGVREQKKGQRREKREETKTQGNGGDKGQGKIHKRQRK